MSTPKKVTMWGYDPKGDRQALATFTFDGEKVNAKYLEPNAKDREEEMNTYGVYDHKKGKSFFPKDGKEFMQALPDAYKGSTYVKMEIDD